MVRGLIMSIALLMRLAMAEEEARKIIERAEVEAQKIIQSARVREREILSESHIQKLAEALIEEYKQKLVKKSSEIQLELDEEFERLLSISDEELDEIAEMLVEAIFK